VIKFSVVSTLPATVSVVDRSFSKLKLIRHIPLQHDVSSSIEFASSAID